MTNLVQGEKVKTEIRELRERYGITVTELCQELNLYRGHYSTYESGRRSYKGEKYEEFYYRVSHALETIRRRRLEESYKIKSKCKIVINEFDEEEEEEILVYQPISEELYTKALQLMSMGKNILNISIKLEIDELELEKRIIKEFGKEEGEQMVKGIILG